MTNDVPRETLDKYRELVEHLAQLTRVDSIKWREAPKEEHFVTSIGTTVISLSVGETRNREPLYIVSLVDESGKLIDSFTDEDIEQNGNYFKLLGELVASIRRKLTGADEVLDSLLREMRDIIPF